MFKKHKLIDSMVDVGIVAIIRVENREQAEKSVDACLAGGIAFVEVAFTMDKAHRIIESISGTRPACALGAGTIIDSETARIAILSGAQYIVSPSFNKETAKLCNRYAVPYMAGCYTPAEVLCAMEYGVDIIKLFPASGRSPSILKAFQGPLPQANFMPTGGVSLDNSEAWIKAGAIALGVGGDLTAGIRIGDYQGVTDKAKAYVASVKKARGQQ